MQTVKERLESLYKFLDEEGWHVRANTVALALEYIEELEKENEKLKTKVKNGS